MPHRVVELGGMPFSEASESLGLAFAPVYIEQKVLEGTDEDPYHNVDCCQKCGWRSGDEDDALVIDE
eukprot:3230281-Heterocapsa_arctica.AAC.1